MQNNSNNIIQNNNIHDEYGLGVLIKNIDKTKNYKEEFFKKSIVIGREETSKLKRIDMSFLKGKIEKYVHPHVKIKRRKIEAQINQGIQQSLTKKQQIKNYKKHLIHFGHVEQRLIQCFNNYKRKNINDWKNIKEAQIFTRLDCCEICWAKVKKFKEENPNIKVRVIAEEGNNYQKEYKKLLKEDEIEKGKLNVYGHIITSNNPNAITHNKDSIQETLEGIERIKNFKEVVEEITKQKKKTLVRSSNVGKYTGINI